VGDSEGIVVVGGATGDDLAEFLPWDQKDQGWKVLGKLHRGRSKKSFF
jgi:hypothetical protein